MGNNYAKNNAAANKSYSPVLFCFLILSVLLLYLRVIYHEFNIYDDPDYITLNPYVIKGISADGIKWAFLKIHGDKTYWHPLTWLSHMLDCQLFGLNPSAHHLVNVFFHIINSVLVFLFIKRLTHAEWKSAIVAILFALHPIQVETVAWIAERKNLLTTMFALISLNFYLKYARESKLRDLGFTTLFFVLCLMAKPALVPLPFLMILLDLLILKRVSNFKNNNTSARSITKKPFTYILLEKLPLFICSAVISIITIIAHQKLGGLDRSLPIGLRLENFIVSISIYIQKTFLPIGFPILYPHPGKWEPNTRDGALVIFILFSALALWRLRRNPFLIFGWLWFLGMLIPASGIIQAGIQALAFRFVYFPIIGLFIAVVWGIAEILSQTRKKNLISGVIIIIVIVASFVLSSRQLSLWQSSLLLFEDTLKRTKNNYVGHCNYGLSLFYRGNFKEAKEQFIDALRIRPNFVEARINLGMVLEQEGDLNGAIENYKLAAELKPDLAYVWKMLGNALAKTGNFDEAIKANANALRLNPNDPEVLFNQGFALSNKNRIKEAIEHYRRCIELNPYRADALNNLAWLLAASDCDDCRNGKQAVELAEKAKAITGGQKAVVIGTLAAAYAEAGRFDDAIKTAEEAIQCATQHNEPEIAEINRKLLNYYKNKIPVRESIVTKIRKSFK